MLKSERAFFEPRFGQDFSHVHIHSNLKAAEMARALNARAFTVGCDIVFGTREYAPGTHEGRRLVAHELTHVVQQAEGADGIIQRTATVRHRRRVDNRPDLIRFEMDRPANHDALLAQIRTDLRTALSGVVWTPILARIGDLSEDMSGLLDQTEGQSQIVFELSVAWSSSTTVDQVSLLSPYVEPAVASVAEAPGQEHEAEGTGTIEEQLSVLERHIELSRSLIQASVMTRVRQRRTEGYRFGVRMAQAAMNVQLHNNSPTPDDWDFVPHEQRQFIRFVEGNSPGRWQLSPPIVDIDDPDEMDGFVEGVNAGLREHARVERVFGVIAQALERVRTAQVTSGAARPFAVTSGPLGVPQLAAPRRGGGGAGSGSRSRRVVRRRERPLREEEPGMAAWRESLRTRPPRRMTERPRIPPEQEPATSRESRPALRPPPGRPPILGGEGGDYITLYRYVERSTIPDRVPALSDWTDFPTTSSSVASRMTGSTYSFRYRLTVRVNSEVYNAYFRLNPQGHIRVRGENIAVHHQNTQPIPDTFLEGTSMGP